MSLIFGFSRLDERACGSLSFEETLPVIYESILYYLWGCNMSVSYAISKENRPKKIRRDYKRNQPFAICSLPQSRTIHTLSISVRKLINL